MFLKRVEVVITRVCEEQVRGEEALREESVLQTVSGLRGWVFRSLHGSGCPCWLWAAGLVPALAAWPLRETRLCRWLKR